MKTLKVEPVYLNAYETFKDVTADLPRFIDGLTVREAAMRVKVSKTALYEALAAGPA